MRREGKGSNRNILIPESPDPVPRQRVRHAVGGTTCDDQSGAAFRECNVTCQVRLLVSDETEWTLETLNIYGEPTKSNNLDEMYMIYHTHSQSVAGNRPLAIAQLERDLSATTSSKSTLYRVKFFASPMNYRENVKKQGHISIHFQFTDGIGELPPPSKQEWRNGGYSHTRYIFRNVERPPVIHPFVPPLKTIDLSQFSSVLAFGDSILEQLVGLDSSKREIQFGTKVAQPLQSRSVATLLESLRASFPPSGMSEKDVLILNSALWDVLSDQATAASCTNSHDDPWEDHCKALRTYLQEVRSMYSSTKVAWLLPTAVHIHRVYLADVKLESRAPQKINRCRYMSCSRCSQLHTRQKEICEELNVPTLDLFQATYLSADWTLPGDGRHFQPELNQKMLGWFY